MRQHTHPHNDSLEPILLSALTSHLPPLHSPPKMHPLPLLPLFLLAAQLGVHAINLINEKPGELPVLPTGTSKGPQPLPTEEQTLTSFNEEREKTSETLKGERTTTTRGKTTTAFTGGGIPTLAPKEPGGNLKAVSEKPPVVDYLVGLKPSFTGKFEFAGWLVELDVD